MKVAWRTGIRRRFAIATGIALLALAGCGGGGGSSSPNPTAGNGNPPILNNPGNKSVTALNNLAFSVNATDSDGPAPLVLDISSSTPALPSGVFTDDGGGNGTFNWTPTAAQVATYNITFRARESGGNGQASTQTITITVNANAPPNLTKPGNKTVIAGSSLAFAVSATDSDGPSPLVLDISSSTPALPSGVFTDNGGGNGTFNWTPTAAQVATYNITFRAREAGASGQTSTQNIIITVNANAAPNLANPGNKMVSAGNSLNFAVTATDADGPGPLVLDISSSTPALPSGVFTDNGGGNGTFNWTPTAGQVATYNVTFRARENNGIGQASTQNLTIMVNPAGGLLSVAAPSAGAFTNNLTSQGTLDWMHFGLTNDTSINRKSGVAAALNYGVLSGTALRFPGNPTTKPSHQWTDGTPTAAGGPFPGGFYFEGQGSSFRITATADTNERTLRVYLGGADSTSTLNVELSDGSAAPFITTLSGASVYSHEVTVAYKAASAGQTVEVTLTANTTTGNIAIQAASLTGPPFLPISDNFNDGNADGWFVVDESAVLGNWAVLSGQLTQQAKVETASARIGTYQLGSYMFLNTGSGLIDYRLSVDATHVVAPRRLGEDIGVLFRYQNPDNYYRFSMNSRHGYARLEKRASGTFSTLAVNSRGYRANVTQNIVIEVRGSTIFVTVNGDPIFSTTDSSVASGTVALYAKHYTRFDNVSITDPSTAPAVILSSPIAYSVTNATAISASALTANAPDGGNVRFTLDGDNAIVDSAAPFTASWPSVAAGNHTLLAELRNSANSVVATDANELVGTGGDEIVAVGDSIINGTGDQYLSDNVSDLERFIGFQGPQATQTDTLDATRGTIPTLVINEGQGGDQASDAANSRIDSIRARYPGMDRALIGLGTNEGVSLVPEATYTANMQTLIDKIRFNNYPTNTIPSGIDIHVSTVPPAFLGGADPYNSVANIRIREYNNAITTGVLQGHQVGPDLFAFFMPSANVATHRQYLMSDALHPTGLGHEIIATLWHNNLQPGLSLALPWFPSAVVSSAWANLPQVDLIEVGDTYRVLGSDTITSFPGVLTSGRWILTDNDSSNASANYLSFTVDRDVTVYIAYDGGASSRPNWMSTYTATGTNITTTDANGPTMNLFSRMFTSGATITLGGNNASGAGGSNTNYVVIVVEN